MNIHEKTPSSFTIITIEPAPIGTHAVWDFAALRIRDRVPAGFFHESIPSDDMDTEAVVLPRFLKFIGSDPVIGYDLASSLDQLNALCHRWDLSTFSGPVTDISALAENKFPPNLRKELAPFIKVLSPESHSDASVRCRAIWSLCKALPAAGLRHSSEKKSVGTAYVCLLLGVHYFYLRTPLLNIFYWLTLGGLGLWFFFDFFRLPLLVDRYNEGKPVFSPAASFHHMTKKKSPSGSIPFLKSRKPS